MLRRTEQLIKADTNAILRMTFDMPKRNIDDLFQELVDDGLVDIIKMDDTTYYAAKDGPSLYSIIQEKILADLLEDK